MAKKKAAILGVSSILLVAMVVAVAVTATRKTATSSNDSSTGSSSSSEISASAKAVKQICQPTDYKETCEETLSGAAGNTTDPQKLVQVAFNVTINHINEAIKNSSLLHKLATDPRAQDALENCQELLDFSINDLKKSFATVGSFNVSKMSEYMSDLKTWLSASITYQQTCLDGFENTTGDSGEEMKKLLQLSGELTSNGLAIVTELSQVLSTFQLPANMRRLLSEETDAKTVVDADGVPSWVGDAGRRLLSATPATVTPNVVVAQDGSGKYKTINAALADVPKNGNSTFVIYVKAGVYAENVNITRSMDNVFLIGDGPTKTKITGSRSYIGGYNTYKTATVCADGERFMAKDIGIENSAGAEKHQAVALRVSSDRAILYNCQLDGYQDTLYAHAHRQFYRDCTISGTVDFIFGDAAVVFQNCKLVINKPLENQSCMVTAQGRTDKRGVTGIVLQNCTITASPEYQAVQAEFKSYLGRPWKNFSRTIVMQSDIEGIIDPTGWAPWIGTINLDTLWYAEYSNRGAGAKKTGRVKWAGIQKKITADVAVTFTPSKFIDGNTWIPATGVPYVPDMIKV
ncbi:putative pectinesterase/pectinesterase inhibitor 28 [Rhododendron vialii]|uniref:putative pectinesterase/pectinesterase inhibitor 28 n=1 Tax=Rhododendron vialii TaxID=182163 RepID=UPI00265F6032|nr:putative pectinesterase/pectinesterase inhibitor 28 [Rhododendron vialii]